MNIVFDLDGTLINSKPRLYNLFQLLVPSSTLSYDEYWAFKENKITHEKILANQFGYQEAAIAQFVKQWMDLIETPAFLALDTNFPGIHDTLAGLSEQAQLLVCTARQHRKPVLEQLERLGLLPFFSHVLVTERRHSKDDLIRHQCPELNGNDWMIGDTGEDVKVGKSLQIKTCAVLSGFLNKQSLMPYAPDLILGSVNEFKL